MDHRYDDPIADALRHFGAAARAASAAATMSSRQRAEREARKHRQGLRELSPDLRAAARDLDRLAEWTPSRDPAPRREHERPEPEPRTTRRPHHSSEQGWGEPPARGREPAQPGRTHHAGAPDLRGDVIEVHSHLATAARAAATQKPTGQSTWQMPTASQLAFAADLAKKRGEHFDINEARTTMSFQQMSKKITELGGDRYSSFRPSHGL